VLAALGLTGLAVLLIAVGLPADLLGSAPREQAWSASPGEVRVVDGETLRLGDRILRLAGLMAPQRGESCRDRSGAALDCGAASAAALARLVAGQPVSCRVQGRDRYGRGLGQCEAGGMDVNAALVAAGFALAEASVLRPTEVAARQSGRGLWAGGGALPEAWRGRD